MRGHKRRQSRDRGARLSIEGLNILVTGAAGYIGSICAEELLNCGASVIALDNLAEGYREAVPAGALFVEGDLRDRAILDQVFAQNRVDAVMHFAGESVVSKSMREPSTFYDVNVARGLTLVDAMTRHGVKKLIFSSTAAVYGEPKTLPIPEDHSKNPVNPYGKSKWRFEQLLADFAEYTGLQHVSLRYFNAAGATAERGEDHRVETHLIPNVLKAAAGELPHVDVFGDDYPTPDGTCLRDYVHVMDIAEAHILALRGIERVAGAAYNVGNSRGYSVLEVLQTAGDVTGREIPHKISPRRAGDPAVLVASSERITRELGWEPRHSTLNDILESAWRWKHSLRQGFRHGVPLGT